jgi:hypothetical protein
VLAFFQKLPPCLVGIEACASSHHWSRELQALGHTVRLMPPPAGEQASRCDGAGSSGFRCPGGTVPSERSLSVQYERNKSSASSISELGGRRRRAAGGFAYREGTIVSVAPHHHDRAVRCGWQHGCDRTYRGRTDESLDHIFLSSSLTSY